MRALILAAGAGGRSRSFERHKPCSMLELGGRTLLAAQVSALQEAGIREITVVTGFGAEQVRVEGAKLLHHTRWRETHILGSLATGWAGSDDLIVSYGDILYDPKLLTGLVKSPHGITLLHDTLWRTPYAHRLDKAPESAETLILGEGTTVRLIGKNLPYPETINGEFVGLLRLNSGALSELRDLHAELSAHPTRSLQRSRDLASAALTDLLQEHIDRGGLVHSLPVNRGWMEIDSIMDYEHAKMVAVKDGVSSLLM